MHLTFARSALLLFLSLTSLATAETISLFDGKSLEGWTGEQKALWRVEEGAITFGGNGKPHTKENWLSTTRTFENFELKFKAKTSGDVGTGMFFRSEVAIGKRIVGWQSDIGQSFDGGLYKEGANGGMIAYPAKEMVQKIVKPEEWNEYRIRAEGRRLQTWVNGVQTADLKETGGNWRRSGSFALETSPHGSGKAQFKDLVVETLPPSPESNEPEPAQGAASRMTDIIPAPPKLSPFQNGKFNVAKDDVIVFTGSENMVLEQRSGWLESSLVAGLKEAAPKFRHMSWEGDTVFRQNRMDAWGSWPENLSAARATAVVSWFGQVEAMDDTKSVDEFAKSYGSLLDEFYKRTPRIVIVGPPLFEIPNDPRVRDNTNLNDRIRQFNEAARKLAKDRNLVFVDLVAALEAEKISQPLTRDGMHFSTGGLKVVGKLISASLGVSEAPSDALRTAVVEKNRLWFDTWRCMNWAFAFGDRTTQPFAKGAAEKPALVEELKKHQPILAHAEATIQAISLGKPLPEKAMEVPHRADPPAVTPEQEMTNFKLRPGFSVNLFADEKLGVVRPIQIRWDERGRLWVACTPAYPQLQPGEHGNDYILVLEDTNGDGKADKSSRFAEHLTMPMGFEFAAKEVGGGLYVCESTQLVHLPDPNGDDKADGHEIILSGFGTGDTHQDANSLRWGADGCLWFTQGYHIWSYVETPHGLAELNRSGVWRFNPRTLRLDSFLNESTAGLNCWGTAWDDYGQIFHGSGADTQIWFTTPAIIHTLHVLQLPTGMAASKGKSMEPEFLGSSHLPDDLRGVLLKSTYYTSQVQLYRLRDAGSGFASEELGDLMSGSNEFRPVETRVGPDGALYVCDWLNPVIGHYQASYRDPRRDRSHGRIWRVTANDRPLVKHESLANLAETALIAKLESTERWERDVAKFALYRRSKSNVLGAVENRLKTLGTEENDRLLYELSGVLSAHEVVDESIIQRLLNSKDFRFQAWGTHLIGVWADKLENPLPLLAKAMAQPHPRVRLEAIVAAAWMPPIWAPEALKIATLALEQPTDAPINYALTQCIHALAKHWQPALTQGKLDFGDRFHALARVLTTIGDKNVTAKVRDLLASDKLTPGARDSLLSVLIENGTSEDADFAISQAPESQAVMDALVAVAWRKRDAGYGAVLGQLLNSPHAAARISGCRIVSTTGQDFGTAKKIEQMFGDAATPPKERAAAIGAVAKLRGKAAFPEIMKWIDSPEATIRASALAAAAPLDLVVVATRCAQLLNSAKATAEIPSLFTPILNQKSGAETLAKALVETKPSPEAAKLALQWMAEVGRDDVSLRNALNAAAGIVSNTLEFSEALVKSLVQAASAKGNAKQGEAIFKSAQTTCLACHKVGAEGGVLGPDLTAIGRAMTPEAITESVLWPKRQVKEGFLMTQVTTKSGQTFQGYKSSETPELLTLKDVTSNALQPIAKTDIATRNDAGTLMPEGLTAWMTEEQRLDLLQYLFQLGK